MARLFAQQLINRPGVKVDVQLPSPIEEPIIHAVASTGTALQFFQKPRRHHFVTSFLATSLSHQTSCPLHSAARSSTLAFRVSPLKAGSPLPVGSSLSLMGVRSVRGSTPLYEVFSQGVNQHQKL